MSSSDYYSAYPTRALSHRIAGEAVIDCRVEPDTTIGECMVLSESPPGEGFGAAAIKLSRFYRARPPCPYDKAHLKMPFRFTLPSG